MMKTAPEVWDWFIGVRDPREIFRDQPTYLLAEIIFYAFATFTFRHALRHGGRYIYLWFAAIFHGLVVESLSYFLPEEIDNFWHAQSMVMLLGRRLPLHIMLFYPSFYYNVAVSVDKLKLKKWVEPFVVGLTIVLVDVPFDIMGIKLLWWTWHDTDPNIYDRHYWVPWTSYYFHATFCAAYAFIFHSTHRWFTKNKWENKGFAIEMLCTMLTGLFSMPAGILLFLPIYHPLHDNYGYHTKYSVYLLFAGYLTVIWAGWTHVKARGKRTLDELGLIAIIHYMTYVFLVLFARPELQRSTGLHEKTGPCNQTSPVYTAFGQVLSKRSFLCTSDYDEQYFDFHCLPGGKAPPDGLDWYTICGNAYPNHLEYMVVVIGFCIVGALAFYRIHSTPLEEKQVKTE